MTRNNYKVPDVPEGVSGDWSVKRFTVSEEESKSTQFRSVFQGGRGYVPSGTYTKLTRHGSIIMSDTPDEIGDHIFAIHNAKGHCLINGLGLGVVLNGMLMDEQVEHVTVIEESVDVLNLVRPHYERKYPDKITFVNADAMTWRPPVNQKYDVVWHDIWDNICSDNLPNMHKLHRKYGRRCKWQGSWAREYCER